MIKLVVYKIFIFLVLLCFLSNEIFSKTIREISSDNINKYQFKRNQIIEFKLKDGRKIIIKYIEKTETYILGNLVNFESGNYVTNKEEIKISFEEIAKFKVLLKPSLKTTIILFGTLTVIFLICYGISKAYDFPQYALR